MRQLKIPFLTKQVNDEFYKTLFLQLSALLIVAAIFWFGGPYLSWEQHAPFTQPEKRIYVILFLCLIWLLKFLILDLDTPRIKQPLDPQAQKKLTLLQNRFQGVLRFLNKTPLSRHNKSVRLQQLPWYLLLGPENAGKTAMLTHSGVHFILQRQRPLQPPAPATEQCDWWVTQHACLLDVPGKYQEDNSLWTFFLNLIKQQRGTQGIHGIIIALPFAEMMKQDPKEYQPFIRRLLQRMSELQSIFQQSIPCQIVMTKCDLLPGFSEFFSESGNDEITQAWGITLPTQKHAKDILELMTERFNALIKRLNQQLLWRLHHERNPIARVYIKDFPLQIEALKKFTMDFIKKFLVSQSYVSLQGIYLTSALQNTETESSIISDTVNTTERALQIFKEPVPNSRSYFIKQFITHGMTQTHIERKPASPWKRRLSYAASITAIAGTLVLMGNDFVKSMKQNSSAQVLITQYQLAIRQNQDPVLHLEKTLALLNALQPAASPYHFNMSVTYLLSFYSNKSQEKQQIAYYQILQTILLPEIKNYFEDYLKLPVNKNTDQIYAVLKSYLMLGDIAHRDAAYIATTMQAILPKSIDQTNAARLMAHVHLAFSAQQAKPLLLNETIIQQTRKYLNATPRLQQAYIILRNMNENTTNTEINLGTDTQGMPILVSPHVNNQIPAMFTTQLFTTIFDKEVNVAATEALTGNWVLGNSSVIVNKQSALVTGLTEQLRNAYVDQYIDVWESLLTNIQLAKPNNLLQVDNMISQIISTGSPLLTFLQTVRDNTYVEPIFSASTKLQSLNLMLDKNHAYGELLYQIFNRLQLLHQYIQIILTAKDEKKAAFDVLSKRSQNLGAANDAISELRVIAARSPEPIKNWLNKIANDTWHFMLQEAAFYLDTSWQTNVIQMYQTEIANRYPFSTQTNQEVDIKRFTDFFGNPGVILGFYKEYLQIFVDTSTPEWHWKMIDNNKLPFSDKTLQQIQEAMLIHQTFFPNGDNKIFVRFTLQPYLFSKHIKNVKLNINDKEISDNIGDSHNPHILTWPRFNQPKMTAVQLSMSNNHVISRRFPGDWGWFKLVNQSFESALNKKQMLLNLSANDQPAKYLLFIEGQPNPFLNMDLSRFRLSPQLMHQK